MSRRFLQPSTAVIFDLDGTLFDTFPLAVYAFHRARQDVSRRHNVILPSRTDEELLAAVGHPGENQPAMLLPAELQQYGAELLQRVQHHETVFIKSGRASLFPGAYELLNKLRREGLSTYLASNCSLRYRDLVCQHFELDSVLERAYCIGMLPGQRKSDLVRKLLQQEGFQEGIMVGDRSSDMQAGFENELVTVACRYGFGRPDELAGADFSVDSVPELRSLLLQGS